MSGRLHWRNEGRYDFSRHADGPAQRLVDNRPLRLRANAEFPVRSAKFHQAIEPRALRSIADPGPRGDAIALDRGAQIIDLVADDDPEIGVLVRRIGHRLPVRD